MKAAQLKRKEMKTHRDIKTILVPVPLNSEFSIPLEQAMHFSKVYGAEIIIMNVVSRYSIFHQLLNPEKLAKHKKKARKKLRKHVKRFFRGEVPQNVKTKIIDGSLLPSILKTAKEVKSDLIIIKKAKRPGSRLKFLRAENASKLIAEAVCPVFTINVNPTPEKISNILIPVEIFKRNENKVAWAASLSKAFHAKLHVVSVLDADIKVRSSLSYKQSRKIEKELRNEGAVVQKVILKSNGERHPATEILEHAREIKPDMLVIMARKESALRDSYLGSFAKNILNGSSYPVFSVVPGNEKALYDVMKPIPDRVRNKDKQKI